MMRILLLLIASIFLYGCASNTSMLNYGERSFQQENYDQAFCILLPIAKKGNCDAQYAVGYMYFYGKGVVEDSKQAQYWINKAAQQGQPLAIKALEAQCAVQLDCPPSINPYAS